MNLHTRVASFLVALYGASNNLMVAVSAESRYLVKVGEDDCFTWSNMLITFKSINIRQA